MKYKSIFNFIVILGLLIAFVECGKNSKNPVGSKYIEPRGAEKDTVFYASPLDTFYHNDTECGISSYLYLGETEYVKAKTLIWFSNLPDSGTLDSAVVTLTPDEIIGPSTGVFTASVHLIQNDWDEYETTWETFKQDQVGEEITTFELNAAEIAANLDSLKITFRIPILTVQSWIDTATADNNYGILISYDLSDFVVGFDSRALSGGPKLDIYATQDTTQFHETISPIQDAFIATSKQTERSDRIFVTNGSALRSFLNFDVTSIQEDATINRALIVLHVDTLLSVPDNSTSFYIYTYPIKNSVIWPISSVELDSTISALGTVSGDSATFNITSIMQNWTSGKSENYGLILKGSNEVYNLHQRGFFSTESDSLLQPHLEVYYTLPPSSRL